MLWQLVSRLSRLRQMAAIPWVGRSTTLTCRLITSPMGMRYFVDAQFWDPMSGPILFYAGNEGQIESFYENSGFLTKNLSSELKGLIVFGEHRYFGKSMPFDSQYAYNTSNNTYLTVD